MIAINNNQRTTASKKATSESKAPPLNRSGVPAALTARDPKYHPPSVKYDASPRSIWITVGSSMPVAILGDESNPPTRIDRRLKINACDQRNLARRRIRAESLTSALIKNGMNRVGKRAVAVGMAGFR